MKWNKVIILSLITTLSFLMPQFLFSQTKSDLFVDVSNRIDFARTNGGAAGAAWFDYNNDGSLDLFIPNGMGNPNGLFRNNGDGTFTDVAKEAGVTNGLGNHGVVAGDIDNDGWADLFMTAMGGVFGITQSATQLYHNNGDGTFSDITSQAGVFTAGVPMSAAFVDINNDGFLDVFVTFTDKSKIRRLYNNKLFLNNGDLTFTDISKSSGVDSPFRGCAVGCSDYNDDGWTDLFVANCNAEPIELFRNNGDLTFTNVTTQAGLSREGFWMAITHGDYDNDGDLDLFSTNLGNSVGGLWPHALYQNNGNGTYTHTGIKAGLVNWEFGWGASFADFDNDGYLDIFFAGSSPAYPLRIIGPGRGCPGRLFMNNGNGTFSMTKSFGLESQYTSGVSVADFDNNGFPDLVIVTSTVLELGKPVLLQNVGNTNSWITVKTVGTQSNRDGVGARVKVMADDFVQMQEVRAGSSVMSMESPWLTFGLGDRQRVDIEVRWPSGLVERFLGQTAKQTVTLVEGTAKDLETNPWDTNSDGEIDILDLVDVASQFGQSGADLSGDINGDGMVDVFDLVIIGEHLGEKK